MSNLFQTGVRPIIDNHLLEESKKVRDYGGYWSASSAGYCMRKLIFERLGVPTTQEDDPRKQRVFSVGHIFHDWIQELTCKAGISIAQEVELQDEELMVRGHFDDLILVPDSLPISEYNLNTGEKTKSNAHLILYDYKTVNSRSFMWAKKNGNGMSHFHRYQLGTYLYMLRKNFYAWYEEVYIKYGVDVKDVAESRILKIEKENLMMGEQQLMWTPDLEKDVVGYWRTLNGYWNNKKIPACTCADYEGGFMSREKFNPYFYNDQPCSLAWYSAWRDKQEQKT